jgi:hypothetical protein
MDRGRALFFVAGLTAGTLIGALWFPVMRDGPTRTPRSESPASAGGDPVEPVSRDARQPESTPLVEPRFRGRETNHAFGWLEVDFNGFPGRAMVRVEGTTMKGRRDYAEHGSASGESRRVRIELAPGIYEAGWQDLGAMNRYRARVRIAAGDVTHVRATNDGLRVADEAGGLAVMTVNVIGREGRGQPGVLVRTSGPSFDLEQEWGQRTNEHGSCRFRLKGGSYTISVGAAERHVRLAQGERSAVEFRAGSGFGEVVVSPALPGDYRLRSMAQGGQDLGPSAHSVGGAGPAQVGFVFTRPGRYALTYVYRAPGNEAAPPLACLPDELVVARLAVVDGKTTTIPHSAAPGVIEVQVTRPAEDGHRLPIESIVTPMGSDQTLRGTRRPLMRLADVGQRAVFTASVGPLEPGWHEVAIVAGDRKWLRHALVGFGPTRVSIALDRDRGAPR